MSLDILRRRAQEGKDTEPLPDWVSQRNITLPAYQCINAIKQERLKYIIKHGQIKDYKKKGLYQITASEVARAIGVATTTLISSSAYSFKLKRYLDDINKELEQKKNHKIIIHKRTISGGLQQRKKDELKIELGKTKTELKVLKKRNAHEQVSALLAELPLPIKRKLGLDV